MASGSTRLLLYKVADRIGRSRADMDKPIRILETNWYQTEQSLISLKTEDYERMGIPSRLAVAIMETLKTSHQNQSQSSNLNSPVQILRNIEKKLSQEEFRFVADLLSKIFSNIRNNLTEEKYRTLKKSNKAIESLIGYPGVRDVLLGGGFEEGAFSFVMGQFNISTLDDWLGAIEEVYPQQKFDPYSQHIMSTSRSFASQFPEESSFIFNEKLAQLEQDRQKLMSKPIKDRQIRIYRLEPEERAESWNFEDNPNDDERDFIAFMKAHLSHYGAEQNFMSRRKQQYIKLLKTPCYSETLIRIKLLKNFVFQCKFSPLEPLSTMLEVFNEQISDRRLSYHIFMTPPVEIIEGALANKTFHELGCVPRAVFYFKTEQDIEYVSLHH